MASCYRNSNTKLGIETGTNHEQKFKSNITIKSIVPPVVKFLIFLFLGWTDRQTVRPTDRPTDIPTDRKTDRKTDRQTNRQTNGLTDQLTD